MVINNAIHFIWFGNILKIDHIDKINNISKINHNY
jgi:hypothetical protein